MNIIVRSFKKNDASNFHVAVLDSIQHVPLWLPWCDNNYTVEDSERWIVSAIKNMTQRTDFQFVIEDRDTTALLGVVGITPIEPYSHVATLGYWVRHSVLNQGVSTAAALQAIKLSFSTLGITRLEMYIHTENHASLAVAKKLGGKFECTQRNRLKLNDQFVDAHCYSITTAPQ